MVTHHYTEIDIAYIIYPIDTDIYNIDINIASTAGPPQGHRGGGGVHNTPTSNTEANNPTDPGNTTTQHHRPTQGGGGVYPPYTMRGGGVGVATLYHIYVPVPSFASAGVPPPMVWSHHGRQGPHTVLCWQQLHEQTVFYNPVCRTLHSTGGEGKMMMCVCVDIACVFYTSSWYVPCVI